MAERPLFEIRWTSHTTRSSGWPGSSGCQTRARADAGSNASRPRACGDSAMRRVTRHRRVHARIA